MERKTFPVYIIYSLWSMREISDFLESRGGSLHLQVIRNVRDNNAITNRTFAILEPQVFDKLIQEGFTPVKNIEEPRKEFAIAPFMIKKNNYPTRDNHQSNFYVPIPQSVEDPEMMIRTKIEFFSSFLEIPQDSYAVRHKKGDAKLFVSFNGGLLINKRVLLRLLLDGSCWNDENVMQCFWAFKRNNNRNGENENNKNRNNRNNENINENNRNNTRKPKIPPLEVRKRE